MLYLREPGIKSDIAKNARQMVPCPLTLVVAREKTAKQIAFNTIMQVQKRFSFVKQIFQAIHDLE